MAPSFFEDLNASVTSEVLAADDRTLRLAASPLTEEEVLGLLRYQEAFLSIAEADPGPEGLARAYTEALKASGLPEARRVDQGNAIIRTFAGQRWAVGQLQDKVKQLEAQGAEAQERRQRIEGDLAKLERRTALLARRYGEQTLALLRQHEARLLALHVRMDQVLNRG
ncbi:hypothetical protein [Stigmatella aurantiaca]|uniref:Conserved uncharacterized protein n=1 Tax=Stigmatella aurantiaca (strain DW4/3-1) TaxID=378806 RepID=Q08PZ9_STIAD|nr:hypothetical protein [Stigmatella aurantiaca]ADO72109.1 conserved uncharacterized protein [Stigmatella aurantiaca DW4/3-1]EAU62559.1 hypothetical protein STIAU_6546 [Stigmatella aurantiaca DW4/3-1]